MSGEETIVKRRVDELLEQMRAGNLECRGELLEAVQKRLVNLARSLKHRDKRVSRWEQTEDIMQNAAMRLYQAMSNVEIQDAAHFYNLAAKHIRWELLDAGRRNSGPESFPGNHETLELQEDGTPYPSQAEAPTADPGVLLAWSDFHEFVEKLPEQERVVVDLIWYHGMKKTEAANTLGVDEKVIRRRLKSVAIRLGSALADDDRFLS